MIVFTIPRMRLISLANSRAHWSKKAEVARSQRIATRVHFTKALGSREIPLPPLENIIVRVGPMALDDDNLAISGKHVRDSIAQCLGIDDGDPRLTWRYRQEKPAKYKVPAVDVDGRKLTAEQRACMRNELRKNAYECRVEIRRREVEAA